MITIFSHKKLAEKMNLHYMRWDDNNNNEISEILSTRKSQQNTMIWRLIIPRHCNEICRYVYIYLSIYTTKIVRCPSVLCLSVRPASCVLCPVSQPGGCKHGPLSFPVPRRGPKGRVAGRIATARPEGPSRCGGLRASPPRTYIL